MQKWDAGRQPYPNPGRLLSVDSHIQSIYAPPGLIPSCSAELAVS